MEAKSNCAIPIACPAKLHTYANSWESIIGASPLIKHSWSNQNNTVFESNTACQECTKPPDSDWTNPINVSLCAQKKASSMTKTSKNMQSKMSGQEDPKGPLSCVVLMGNINLGWTFPRSFNLKCPRMFRKTEDFPLVSQFHEFAKANSKQQIKFFS